MPRYRRVLMKLSGEALGLDGKLFDHAILETLADVVRRARADGTQIALLPGAGNIWRGRRGPSARMDAVLADHMGMLGTLINCIAVQDALLSCGVPAKVFSAVEAGRFALPYNPLTVRDALESGTVALLACGSGNPYFTTDTGAAVRALELQVDALLLAKNIDGVYDADPRIVPGAKLLKDMTYLDAQERDLKVMDMAALILCRENNLPMTRVFALKDPENILRVLRGDEIGSFVHP